VFVGRRRQVVAVDRVNLAIADRELVVLLGPSGCGKTTTLRLIAGLEHLSGGEIEIGSRVINDLSPKDRDVALVFQHYALYPHLSVAENLAFGLRMRRTPKGEVSERVKAAARILAIEDLLDRRPHELSGGQQQRVALGRAIVRRPSVYLLDEPLANLDAQLRDQVRLELKRRQRELGMTVLYVTHDQHEAMTLADRLVVMKGGCVQQCDRPQAIYDHPANRFVAGFVGTPAMNFIAGRLVNSEGGAAFECFGRRLTLGRSLADRVSGLLGQPMVLGIRPSHVRLLDSDEGAESIPVRVTMAVPTGDRLEVHVRTSEGGPMVAQVCNGPVPREGSEAWALLDRESVVLFESGAEGANVSADAHGVGAHAA